MRSISEINVSSADDKKLLWLVQATEGNDYAKVVALNVAADCEALVFYANGSHQSFIQAHNFPWAQHEKQGMGVRKIIGIKRNTPFNISFSLKEGVPFKDKEVPELPATVNVTCKCNCEVSDSYNFYVKYGAPQEITQSAVQKTLLDQCQDVLCSEFAKKLEDYDYYSISQSLKELSASAKKGIKPVLEQYGIRLIDCAVDQPFFQPIYDEENECYIEYKIARAAAINAVKQKKENEKRMEADREFILEAQKNLSKANAQPDLKCPRCGNVSPAGTRFCRHCGKELK